MKVLHLDTGREWRGGQRQVLLLARGLRRRGFHQMVLAARQGPLLRAFRGEGIEAAPFGPAALFREAGRADMIHAHDARAHTLAAWVGGRRPLVVSRRVAFPIRSGVLSQWKYSRATRFLAVSEFVKRQLLRAGVEDSRISVVHDGVEMPSLVDAGARQRLVIAPATLDPQKGSALAVEACRSVGAALEFSHGLEHDLPRAALFLYLTHSEGLGSAILLAMAYKTPVVASRTGGIPEIVEHGRTGLLVDNTPAAVAAAIRAVLEDPASAAQRAELAHAQVLARFTDAIMVAQTEQAYRLVLSTGS